MKKFTAQGFTIIELMITLVLAAAVAGIAAPNVSEFIRNRRMTSSANDLLAALYTARSEAIKRQLTTTMCFTTTPTAAAPACDGDGTQGWFAWVDTNANETVDVGEDVIVRHEALASQVLLVTKPASTSRAVSYAPSGFSRPTVPNPLTGVVMCDSRKNKALTGDISTARGVLINGTGRPSVTRSYSTIRDDSSLLAGSTTGAC